MREQELAVAVEEVGRPQRPHRGRELGHDRDPLVDGRWRAVEPSPIVAAGVAITGGPHAGAQRVVLVASVPLTVEGWTPLAEGELLVARAGDVLARVR